MYQISCQLDGLCWKYKGGGSDWHSLKPSCNYFFFFETSRVNCILHSGEGGAVALISIVENFGEIQAIVMKLSDFYWNLLQIIFLAKQQLWHAVFPW